MSIVLKLKTVFHCRCKHCGHQWDAEVKPQRCAKCKYRSWNDEDHRYDDPYGNVPIRSQIENGTDAPPPPTLASLLSAFTGARKVIGTVIEDNPSPSCDHANGKCFCPERSVLTEIEQQIDRLRGLQPRPDTYLVQK